VAYVNALGDKPAIPGQQHDGLQWQFEDPNFGIGTTPQHMSQTFDHFLDYRKEYLLQCKTYGTKKDEDAWEPPTSVGADASKLKPCEKRKWRATKNAPNKQSRTGALMIARPADGPRVAKAAVDPLPERVKVTLSKNKNKDSEWQDWPTENALVVRDVRQTASSSSTRYTQKEIDDWQAAYYDPRPYPDRSRNSGRR
jgi:hypothetical protein